MARNATPMVWEEVTIPESAAPLVKAWGEAKTAMDNARDALTKACGYDPARVNVSTMKIGQGKLSMALKVAATRPQADPSHSTLAAAKLGGGRVNTPSSPAAGVATSLVNDWAEAVQDGRATLEGVPAIIREAVGKRLAMMVPPPPPVVVPPPPAKAKTHNAKAALTKA